MTRWLRRTLYAAAGACALAVACAFGLDRLDKAYPPPLEAAMERSAEVVDRDGLLLRAFATREGRWRLEPDMADVDRRFVDMLTTFEDRRFREHSGVDLKALARAAIQFVANGRIISGGSTLSMQLARLIEPRERRSITAKIMQIARAVQIERRLSKDEILRLYLTLAPYGGNLEGIRAASLAWFGKEPRRLTLAESALLVAIPQLPELRRPDRNLEAARAARARVLARAVESGIVGEGEARLAGLEPLPSVRQALPSLAPHLAETVKRTELNERRHVVTLSRPVQQGLETAANNAARTLGPKLSVAMVMADAQTGEILGEVGSASYLDRARQGYVDMTRAVRSPGSTLKPFIYGLAFEDGRIAQQTIIEDRPANFAGYRPRNFDMEYQGDVSIRAALQMSLNVPAIRLLDAVGPHRLMARFRDAGISAKMPSGKAAGLAIGLGGIGLTLRDLVQLYTGLSNRGQATTLSNRPRKEGETPRRAQVLPAIAAWQIADILSGVNPPKGATQRGIAYKTGTSYGYRDAWAIGFDGRHVLGVWVGRADGSAVPGISGFGTAAPLLFDAFVKSGLPITPLPRAPAGALRQAFSELPVTLRRFESTASETKPRGVAEAAPQIVFPPQGARVSLADGSDGFSPLVLKLQGGRAPFRWLSNGKPWPEAERRRTARWLPDGAGQQTLTVIDAAGRAASVRVFVE
ncbi:penicillin-binding protein 1C [Mesorhizobium australicum]|uniref:peptidoglycan glycosyltransferase n=1 Tax=Mesorhizobium australicum TaxID=536018 RepID=A0A1X7PHT1_9HYPH|nr:penicillin-binding protein 1C [Mesorhizobium australicum]SMH50566.1 penicillin-binding protein 1C [Mesorhizobium australicum]